MTQPNIPSKAELLETLRATGADAAARLRALPPQTFEEGRYENGWNARQILAHVAAIEWTYPRLIDVARQASSPSPERPSAEQPSPAASRPMTGGVNDYNARQVEKRANASVADLIAEFEANRTATIVAVEGADEALLRTPIRSAGGITGPLASVITLLAVQHAGGHLSDIAGPR